ncbi:MAG: amidohydrolase [Gemmatimonadetes bacterium]|nr:amidohydrolase [Gemmatimonadota bacterium]
MSVLLQRAASFEAELVELRRDLHRHPELSFQETRTAALAATRVEALGFEVRRGVGKTGVLAELRNGKGPVVALRADMDALPIQEANQVEYRSTVPGVMHACGHDAHVSMLVGAAQLLAEARRRDELPHGAVRLLFQPSEEAADGENKSGAARMIEDGAMSGVDAVFGLHIGGFLPAGKVYVSAGPIMAGADSFTATVRGVSAHAGRPHEGVDALVLAAHAVVACQSAVARRISPRAAGVLSIGTVHGGVAENVVAERVVLQGTLRYFDAAVRQTLQHELRQAFSVVDALGGRAQVELRAGYPPVVNEPAMAALVGRAVAGTLGESSVAEFEPLMGAEDFALLLEQAPGCFFWLGGAPERPRRHHHPEFDVDERALIRGASALAACVLAALRELGS